MPTIKHICLLWNPRLQIVKHKVHIADMTYVPQHPLLPGRVTAGHTRYSSAYFMNLNIWNK